MAPTHDIYLTWPYPVPSGNAFVAGTWSVPGHGPWDKLPMSRIPGTDTYEVHLDVQEVEDISNYLDDEGYLHHELLEHHHAHDHSFHENQASSASSTPSSTPSSRRRFLSRVFGRSRSSSTASNSAEAPKDLHPDLPYHHQSKDGVILPLTREYRYQFKFVIDDEWKCDPNRSQAPDDKGNWNHEIVVDLVEQVPQYPPSANRSRSSSLQSQHNDHATETEKLQDIPPVEEPPVTAATDDATPTLLSPPAPPVSNQSDSVSSTATTTANITTKGLESKDTIEAVMIFDESQDFSDGEGRSRRGNRDAQPPLESDDNDHDNNNNNNNSNNNINNENVGDDTAKEENVVAPQQVQDQQPHQEQTAPLAIDQEEHYPETPAAAIIVSSAAAELSIAGPDAREHEDISSSLAVSLPETEEHSFVEPTPQENAEIVVPLIEEEVATAVVDLDTVAITPEEPKAVEEPLLAVLEEPLVAVVEEPLVAVEEPLVAAVEEPLVVAVEEPLVVAIEEPLVAAVEEPLVATVVAATEEPAPKPVTPQRRMSYAAAVKTHPVVAEEPKPFVLQAAANPEEKRNKTARAALEVVTDAPAATTYSQVPSPPLTPSSYATDDESLKNELLEEEEQEDLPGPCELSVPLTPKSDMPSFKNLTLTEKTVEARDYSNGSADDNDDNDSETVDVLDDNTSIPSSSSSSSFLSSSALVSRSDETTKLPEQYPNIFWSMCKTTAVVSAAVVVIGLGLGRKKN
ncbi:hypothetical protein BGZ58_001447 [Dissophora ornata]|nr:hypothetical protein BGZ58_001447 [Dissophora ornata]